MGDATAMKEMEEWMKVARSGCVRWIIKVIWCSALFPGGRSRYYTSPHRFISS
jgi:hypothetical protein